MSVLLFADGSKSVGLGHLGRMRTLALGLDQPVRVLTTTPELATRVFADTGITVSAIAGDDVAAEIAARSIGATLVVLDPPFFPDRPELSSGPAWQPLTDTLRADGVPVVRFTDEELPSVHRCNVLINGYPSASGFADVYSTGADRVLAGPQYFLIDPAPVDATELPGDVFVCFGGSDQNDLLDRFIPALHALSRAHRVEIVAGASSFRLIQAIEGASIHGYLSPADFARRLKGARMALTASGNILFERIYHGTPGISVAQFERQNQYGQAFEKLGVTCHLGLGTELDPSSLAEILLRFCADIPRQEEQRLATARIDIAQGSREIFDVLSELANGGNRENR